MFSWLIRRVRALQIVGDGLAVLTAWELAYLTRFELIGDAQPGLLQTFAGWGVALTLLTLYFFLKNGHYDQHQLSSVTDDVMRLFRSNALSVVAFIVVLYFISESRISRITLVLYALCSTLLLIFARLLIRSLIRKARRRGFLLQRAFVVGDGLQIGKYLNAVEYYPGTGISVIGQFGAKNYRSEKLTQFDLDDLEAEIRKQNPDIVILGFKDEDAPYVAEFIGKHYDELFRIQVLNPENHALLGMTTDVVDGLPVMTLNEPRFSLPELAAKRAIDLLGSGLGLLVLSPFLLGLAMMVRISSPGPIFFGQERVGVDGRTFRMWKFRSMRVASPEESKGWTVENDPRRTEFGSFIRKTSLDELPQLWNVLVGDMSLVGPRPEQTHFVEKFRHEIPAYMLRHKMKAGITGWAQVSGWRGDTSLHKRIECDLYYIRNWSFWFDVKILALTFVKGFINKNAY